MKKILFAGGSSMLALNWSYLKKNEYKIILGLHRRWAGLEGTSSLTLNYDSFSKLNNQIKIINPDIIVNTIAITSIDECEKNPVFSEYVNCHIALMLSTICKKNNIKFVHISTDHLFSLNKKYYKETDKTNCINSYAKSKLKAENIIIIKNKRALIIRTNFYCWGTEYRQSITDYIIENLSNNQTIKLFSDVYYSPIFVETLVNQIDMLIKKNKSGLFNIASKKRITKYNFGLKIAEKFDLNKKLIKAVTLDKAKLLTPRPINMSLSNSKIKKINNFIGSDTDEDVNKLFEQKKELANNEIFKQTIPYGRHHIDQKDISSVVNVLKNSPITQGPSVTKFEENICSYLGCKYAVCVSSCTAGLHLAGKIAGLNNKRYLATSVISFVSSANVAAFENSKVFFVDVDNTICISPKLLEKTLKKNKKIKVVMPVHFSGVSCDMIKIKKICDKYKVNIIEDAAHAFGSKYRSGSKIGSCKYSLMSVFSFHPVKSLTTGEGGVVTTNDHSVYLSLLRLRSHGINKLDDKLLNTKLALTNNEIINPWYYEMQELGYNYRLNDIQASLGMSQLSKIDKFINRRRKISLKYDLAFKNLKNCKAINKEFRDISSNHLYILRINFKKLRFSRAELMKILLERGVVTQVHYIPIAFHPFYKKNYKRDKPEIFSAIEYYSECLSLPVYYDLTSSMQNKIIYDIKRLIG